MHKAVQELLEQAERKQGNQHGPRLHSQGALPPLHLQLTPVSSEVHPGLAPGQLLCAGLVARFTYPCVYHCLTSSVA